MGAGITVAENLVTGDEWDQDLRHNTTLGAIAGLGGAGLAGAAGAPGSLSLAGRVLNLTGAGADLAGLGAAGLFDPLLRQFGDDVEVFAGTLCLGKSSVHILGNTVVSSEV